MTGTTNLSFRKKYTYKKIKTVRFKPSASNYSQSRTFVSGTWNDRENAIAVWNIPEVDEDPAFVDQVPHSDNVNDIQYVTRDLFAVGGGSGGIKLFEHAANGKLEEKFNWKKVHSFVTGPAPCTAVACNNSQVASVGEDGKLVILVPGQENISRTIGSSGGCSLYSVIYFRASEILTGTMQGHLKLWDVRASQPSKATLISPDQIAVCNLATHPTQQHLVAAGGGDGALTLWDMRNIEQPITVISAHEGPITEVKFHPTSPSHLFSCGLDGQILHWDASSSARPSHMTFKGNKDPTGSTVAWLTSDVAQGAIDTTCIIPKSILPINSLDVEGSSVIAGSDNEAIYNIKNVLL